MIALSLRPRYDIYNRYYLQEQIRQVSRYKHLIIQKYTRAFKVIALVKSHAQFMYDMKIFFQHDRTRYAVALDYSPAKRNEAGTPVNVKICIASKGFPPHETFIT